MHVGSKLSRAGALVLRVRRSYALADDGSARVTHTRCCTPCDHLSPFRTHQLGASRPPIPWIIPVILPA